MKPPNGVRSCVALLAGRLEVYPVDPDSSAYRFMGFALAVERLAFAEIGVTQARRQVMRLTLG